MATTNSDLLAVDKLMRDSGTDKGTVEGTLVPTRFPELMTYLADHEGLVNYRFTSVPTRDAMGSQTRRLECIISGWFSILDSQTLEPKRFSLDLVSRLVLVRAEADLPALEEEAADEDYIVCGAEMDIVERVQEEILLALPADTPIAQNSDNARRPSPKRAESISGVERVRPTAFAKLAALKKG